MLTLCKENPDLCIPMMGLHPCDVKDNFREILTKMRLLINSGTFIAVGEIGIDLYWDKSTLSQQIEAFEIQIDWAKELQLPIVIHARDAFNEIFEVLDRKHDSRLRGVFHCFTGTLEHANKIMSYPNFLMGIGGVLTYEKSGLDNVVKDIPIEYLVLETDSPFLAPKPYRGKRNESSFVKFVAEKLADIKRMSFQDIAAATSTNADVLFGLSKFSLSNKRVM